MLIAESGNGYDMNREEGMRPLLPCHEKLA